MSISKITRAYVRHYSDNGQRTAYVEWLDSEDKSGRTEGSFKCHCCGRIGVSSHMRALFARAKREGLTPTFECW